MPPLCFISSHSIDRIRPIGISIVIQAIQKDNHDNGTAGLPSVRVSGLEEQFGEMERISSDLSSIHFSQNALI
jgi:hypothetical protein